MTSGLTLSEAGRAATALDAAQRRAFDPAKYGLVFYGYGHTLSHDSELGAFVSLTYCQQRVIKTWGVGHNELPAEPGAGLARNGL